MNLKKGQSNTIMEWIVRIGIVVLLLGVLVSFFNEFLDTTCRHKYNNMI